MNARAEIQLPEVGASFGGGCFGGRFFIGALPFALIVAPAAEADFDDMPWNKSLKSVEGALSYNDGLANTLAMAEAGSKLAQRCLDLRIGGFDDWYLLSRQESLMAFHELRNVEDFKEGGAEAFRREWYWTSTQCLDDPVFAYVQGFDGGSQTWYHKYNGCRGRAVRRLPL